MKCTNTKIEVSHSIEQLPRTHYSVGMELSEDAAGSTALLPWILITLGHFILSSPWEKQRQANCCCRWWRQKNTKGSYSRNVGKTYNSYRSVFFWQPQHGKYPQKLAMFFLKTCKLFCHNVPVHHSNVKRKVIEIVSTIEFGDKFPVWNL